MNMTLIQELAFQQIAEHYAAKIKASGVTLTQEELKKVISENWEKIAREIVDLSTLAESL